MIAQKDMVSVGRRKRARTTYLTMLLLCSNRHLLLVVHSFCLTGIRVSGLRCKNDETFAEQLGMKEGRWPRTALTPSSSSGRAPAKKSDLIGPVLRRQRTNRGPTGLYGTCTRLGRKKRAESDKFPTIRKMHGQNTRPSCCIEDPPFFQSRSGEWDENEQVS